MKVLALDLATRFGWALGKPGAQPTWGSVVLPKTKEDVGSFLLAYSEWLRPFLVKHDPEVVCFEAPLFLMRGKSNINTTLKLMGLATTTELIIAHLAKSRNIRAVQAHQQSWKKHFVGRANFSKKFTPYPPIVIAADHGWIVANNDEADALGVWCYACHTLCPEDARAHDPLAMATGW